MDCSQLDRMDMDCSQLDSHGLWSCCWCHRARQERADNETIYEFTKSVRVARKGEVVAGAPVNA